MGAAPWKSPAAQNPSYSVKDMRELKQFQAMKLQQAKEAAVGKSAGKGDSKSQAPQWAKWNCWNCGDGNIARHRWCEKCHMDKWDAPHDSQEAQQSVKGKGKGKGKKGDAGLKGGGPTADKGVAPAAEASPADELQASRAKALSTMGLHTAPAVADLKPYPRPAVKPEVKSAEALTLAEQKVAELQKEIADRKDSRSADWLLAVQKELESAKAALLKVTGSGPKSHTETREFLERRVSNSEAAAQAAEERHDGNLAALDSQILQLQEIRTHRVKDFAEAQAAFKVRLAEDVRALEESLAVSTKVVLSLKGPAPMEVTTESAEKVLVELLRESPGAVKEDFPTCPDTTEATVVNGLSALFHFYASSGWTVPAVTFEQLGVLPSFAHTLVGSKVWNGFWGVKSTEIEPAQYVPYAMHQMLKQIVGQRAEQLKGMESAAASKRFEDARDAAAARRQASTIAPY